jgi:hypothetical protein
MKQTGSVTGNDRRKKMQMRNPGLKLAEIASDAVMYKFLRSGRDKYGPGEYLQKRVSEEDRELLKNLTAADIQNVRPDIVMLGCSQDDCKTCALRFDERGHKICTFDHRCMFHDNWRDPHPSRHRKRSSVYCFSK